MEINRTTLNSLTDVYRNSHWRSNSNSSNPNSEINYLYNNVCGLAFSIDCNIENNICETYITIFNIAYRLSISALS